MACAQSKTRSTKQNNITYEKFHAPPVPTGKTITYHINMKHYRNIRLIKYIKQDAEAGKERQKSTPKHSSQNNQSQNIPTNES
jgi:hypothetical protein